MTSPSDIPTQPPDPDEVIMRARFAAPDTAMLEEIIKDNERMRRLLEEIES